MNLIKAVSEPFDMLRTNLSKTERLYEAHHPSTLPFDTAPSVLTQDKL